jgi:ABC-type antimicrobial peptide transport system permease subunit
MANFSLLLTFMVGAVIAYQVLALDARDHRQEYTMLRALGYELGFLQRLAGQQAALLAVPGFTVGCGVALALLPGWSASSGLALHLGPLQLSGSLLGTMASCAVAALLARRLQRGTDPAEACQ